jgi:uncharacterized membrane protein
LAKAESIVTDDCVDDLVALSNERTLPRQMFNRIALPKLSVIEWITVAAMVIGLIGRLLARPHAPLWLDEAATGAILSQPTFEGFWREAYWEVSSPVYFLIMRPWTDLFGWSNETLRLPSMLFSTAAPLAILFWRTPGLARTDRLMWAALLALWIPGIGYGQTARCYALEFLFATLQTLAFVRLLDRTSLRSALPWVACCALTSAAHYDAAILAVAQGVLFVVLKRWQAVKCWPSLFLVLPVVILIAWQGPEIARFMRPDTTWYSVQKAEDVLGDIFYLFGSFWWVFVGPLLLFIAVVLGLFRRGTADQFSKPVIWGSVASLFGAIVLVWLGTQRPMMTVRYLAPFAPGFMLALLIFLRVLARGAANAMRTTLLLAAFAIFGFWAGSGGYHADTVVEPLSYEGASHRLMSTDAKTVVFTWDNPNARAMHLEQIGEFGRFFFNRAGSAIEVRPVQLRRDEDPNTQLIRAAQPSNAAIIWVYDTWVHGTEAKLHPPAIAQMSSNWTCNTTGHRTIGVVTCIPRPKS